MHIFQIKMTKSVTKQVQQFEPVKVECEMHAQLDESDDYQQAVITLAKAVDVSIALGFDAKKIPAGKTNTAISEARAENTAKAEAAPKSTDVKSEPETAPAEKPKRKRRTKAEIEADKAAAEAAKAEAADAAEGTETVGSDSEEMTDLADRLPGENPFTMDDTPDDEPAEDVSDDVLMAATNRAVKHLKPAGVRKVMEGFGVKRLGEMAAETRPAYLMGLQNALKAEGVNLQLN